MFTDQIFERKGASTMSATAYGRLIALCTLLEAFFVTWGATLSHNWDFSLMLLIGTFVVSIGAIFLFTSSDNPAVSGFGVTLMSFSMGLMMGPVVALYQLDVVMQAVILTGLVVGLMSLMGLMFPKLFLGMGAFVMPLLVLLIVGGLSESILLAFGVPYQNMKTFDYLLEWAGVVIFAGIVAFDWARAMEMPYTVDNAIDASGGIILDAINIFIRLLAILGNRSSSSKS